MNKQNTTIKLRNEQIEELRTYGMMGDHWPDVIEKILNLAKRAKTQTSQTNETTQTNETIKTKSTEFKTAKVDSYGKASISRTLAGKTIEYRVKQL